MPDFITDRGSVILSQRVLAERWREPTVTRFTIRARILEGLRFD